MSITIKVDTRSETEALLLLELLGVNLADRVVHADGETLGQWDVPCGYVYFNGPGRLWAAVFDGRAIVYEGAATVLDVRFPHTQKKEVKEWIDSDAKNAAHSFPSAARDAESVGRTTSIGTCLSLIDPIW